MNIPYLISDDLEATMTVKWAIIDHDSMDYGVANGAYTVEELSYIIGTEMKLYTYVFVSSMLLNYNQKKWKDIKILLTL